MAPWNVRPRRHKSNDPACTCNACVFNPLVPNVPFNIGALRPGSVVKMRAEQLKELERIAAQIFGGPFIAPTYVAPGTQYPDFAMQPSVPQEPESAQPIMAYRVWHIGAIGKIRYLKSYARPTPWPVGEPLGIESGALVPGLGPPPIGEHNAVGIHAWRDYVTLLNYITDMRAYWDQQRDEDFPRPPDIIGRVALWGDVLEQERGYRAEFAYPQAFFLPYEGSLKILRPRDRQVNSELSSTASAVDVCELARVYGCEVLPPPSDAEIIKAVDMLGNTPQ